MSALSPQKLSLQKELIATFLISATLNSDHVGSIPFSLPTEARRPSVKGDKTKGARDMEREREMGLHRERERERKGASGVKEL